MQPRTQGLNSIPRQPPSPRSLVYDIMNSPKNIS